MSRRRVGLLLATLALVAGCSWLRRDSGPDTSTIDLNHASLRSVEKLPGITPSMAARIVDGRPYTRADELVERGIITARELERIRDRVTVER